VPSPLGHLLGGAVAGGLIAGRTAPRQTMIGFAIAGAIADLDLLFGVHSGPTRPGSAVIAGVIAWVVWANRRRRGIRIALASAACATTRCSMAVHRHVGALRHHGAMALSSEVPHLRFTSSCPSRGVADRRLAPQSARRHSRVLFSVTRDRLVDAG
jgi:hypothetical protein